MFKALRITLYFEICFLRDNDFVKWAKFILFVSEIVISSIILWIGLKNMDDHVGIEQTEDGELDNSINERYNSNFANSIVNRKTPKTYLGGT